MMKGRIMADYEAPQRLIELCRKMVRKGILQKKQKSSQAKLSVVDNSRDGMQGLRDSGVSR